MAKERKGRQHRAADRRSSNALEADIVALADLSIGDLRRAWVDRLDDKPPAIRSRDLLLRMLTWQMQSEAFGGMDAATERTLREIGKALERDGNYEPKIRHDLTPGVVLTREWKGAVHKVIVTEAGFQHRGKRYKSLSDIARTITGTRWSGPRFFGLEQKSARSTRRVAS